MCDKYQIKETVFFKIYYPLYKFSFVVFGLTDTIIHFEHFDRNLFVRSFGSDDSWDISECGGLLALFRGESL